MAEDQTTTTEEEEAPPEEGRKGPGLLIWAALGLAAAGGGFAVPLFLPTADSATASNATSGTSGLGAGFPTEIAFVPFRDVTVNLDEGRLNRYLRLNISLQVDKKDVEMITKLLEERQAVLRNWLTGHLSDKGLDDVRGAAGQNRLRREIQDQFNTLLFPDGYDRIYDVLFEEFNVQ